MTDPSPAAAPALSHLKVLDVSTLLAGPLVGTLLGDFGADVVKLELPGRGDPLRMLPPHKDGVPLWWKVANRNKTGLTLDLRTERGSALLKRMIPRFDVFIENFRPGTAERWGIGPDDLLAAHPGLTILRVSGFGQRGPYAGRPGFHRVGEAMSGYLSIQGEADGPPQHSGYPIADAATGLFGAVGVLIALLDRARNPERAGQVIKVSLLESMFRIVDFLAIQYDQLGEVPARTGNRNSYAAPGNLYRTRDGAWFCVAATTQSIFERLAQAIGRPDLIDDPRFASNPDRVANVEALDAVIAAWMADHDLADVMAAMERHHVAAGPVKAIDDIFADPHVAANDMIVSVMDEALGTIRMQGVVPTLSATPGAVRKPGPDLGADNNRLYNELLGLDETEIEALRRDGVI